MARPNFNELRIQDLTNYELRSYFRDRYGVFIPPLLISLREENNLGWDTGWYLPWLREGLTSNHYCNFFIQYKISEYYSGKGPRKHIAWSAWNEEYYSFNFGYNIKSKDTKKPYWDHSQRDHLVDLSEKGFRVTYITNHVMYDDELLKLAQSNKLCDSLPVLIVDASVRDHSCVSFTQSSTHFLLHSSPKKLDRKNITSALEDVQPTDLNLDLIKIFEVLRNFEKNVGISDSWVNYELHRFEKYQENNHARYPEYRLYAEAVIASRFLQLYLGLQWLRFM